MFLCSFFPDVINKCRSLDTTLLLYVFLLEANVLQHFLCSPAIIHDCETGHKLVLADLNYNHQILQCLKHRTVILNL